MRTIQWSLLSTVAALVSLLLIISCSQEDEVFTGPFLIKDGENAFIMLGSVVQVHP